MPELAETLLLGSKNLDFMKAGTHEIVSLIRREYGELELEGSAPRYFRTRANEQTWWEFDACVLLNVRCVSKHPSVGVDVPAILYTTQPTWTQVNSLNAQSTSCYRHERGRKGVQIAYESLDDFLNEARARWGPTLYSSLQPMITAGKLPRI